MPDISPYLVIPAVTVVVSQVVKFAVHGFSNEIDFKKLIMIGGMPSSLEAAMIALAVTALAVDGANSSVAAATIVLVAVATERFVAAARLKNRLNTDNEALQSLPDNSVKEIAGGGILGFVTAIILSVSYWKDDLSWFFERPTSSEANTYLVIFGLIFVAGEILSYMTRRKSMRKLPTSRRLNRAFRLSLTAPAVTGLIIGFAQKETLGMFDIRIWTYMVFDWIILGTAWAWWSVYRRAKVHLNEEASHFKKTKATTKKKRRKGSKKAKRGKK